MSAGLRACVRACSLCPLPTNGCSIYLSAFFLFLCDENTYQHRNMHFYIFSKFEVILCKGSRIVLGTGVEGAERIEVSRSEP